jgi:NitT/TauT family transport system substrate-binding protein
MPEFLKAVAEFRATGAKLNATYVYDQETGLKLFGKTAFYVSLPDGDYATFLRKGEAEKFASAKGGKLVTFEEAVGSLS